MPCTAALALHYYAVVWYGMVVCVGGGGMGWYGTVWDGMCPAAEHAWAMANRQGERREHAAAKRHTGRRHGLHACHSCAMVRARPAVCACGGVGVCVRACAPAAARLPSIQQTVRACLPAWTAPLRSPSHGPHRTHSFTAPTIGTGSQGLLPSYCTILSFFSTSPQRYIPTSPSTVRWAGRMQS